MQRTLPISKALAMLVGALALVATSLAGAAGAAEGEPPSDDGTIHQTLPIAAADAPADGDCGGITEGTAWHFILTGTESPTAGSTLTATFEDAGTVTAVASDVTGGATHYFVQTGDDDVLTAASVDIGEGQLQLSHVCDAEDTTGGGSPDVCPDGETEITDGTDADEDGLADMCEPEMCPDGETEITDGTDADEDGLADMCEPEMCPDGETEITDDADLDDDGTADMCEVPAEPDTTVELDVVCVDDEVVVTVTGEQALSNIFFYDAEDGVRGGQDTIFEYGTDGDAPLPTPTVGEDGSEEFVVTIPDGAVRVSAKAGLEEEYADLDCTSTVIDDEVDCPSGMVPPANGELVDQDGNGEAENCTSVQGGGVVTDTPVVNPLPDEGETPTTPAPPAGPEQPAPPVDVEGDEVVPAVPAVPTVQSATPASPATFDTPAVMGDVVTRSAQLPRTGSDITAGLVPFGLALLAAGFAVQRSSRRVAGRTS